MARVEAGSLRGEGENLCAGTVGSLYLALSGGMPTATVELSARTGEAFALPARRGAVDEETDQRCSTFFFEADVPGLLFQVDGPSEVLYRATAVVEVWRPGHVPAPRR